MLEAHQRLVSRNPWAPRKGSQMFPDCRIDSLSKHYSNAMILCFYQKCFYIWLGAHYNQVQPIRYRGFSEISLFQSLLLTHKSIGRHCSIWLWWLQAFGEYLSSSATLWLNVCMICRGPCATSQFLKSRTLSVFVIAVMFPMVHGTFCGAIVSFVVAGQLSLSNLLANAVGYPWKPNCHLF